MEFGQRMRIRLGVNNPVPVIVWGIAASSESSLTSLRERRKTAEANCADIIPRQCEFELNVEAAPGLLLERVLNSGNWWSVDNVRYDCETPVDSPTYTFESSITPQDPQGQVAAPALPVSPGSLFASSINSVDYLEDGNQLVLIGGLGFDNTMQVYFGGDQYTGVPAANLVTLSSYAIQCEVPAGSNYDPPVYIYRRSDGNFVEM
jgi:hypothetical protein